MNRASAPADVGTVRAAVERLARARSSLVARPWARIARSLGIVGARFAEPDDPLREEALSRLPEEAGLSPAMSKAVLDGMSRDWSEGRFRRIATEEFEDPGCLDGVRSVRGRQLMAVGPALCVQVVSGSVPGVGVNALVRSLLVKAPTIIKPGRGDVLLSELFERGLREADAPLAEALAVLYWSGPSDDVLAEAVAQADVVVAYGSDATVEAVRSRTAPTTRFVAYHHRLGIGVVGRDALTPTSVDGAARDLARAVALFEQRGCVCPHLVYVESGGTHDGEAFAERLAAALAQVETELPSAPLSATEGAALQQLRGMAELHSAAGGGSVRHGGAVAPWTVLFEREALRDGPVTLARSVRVRQIEDAMSLAHELSPLARHLQSIAVVGLTHRKTALAEVLGRVGASRIVPTDRVSFPPAWWLHDGRGPLRELVRWVEVED